MRSKRSREFRQLLASLPADARFQAHAAYSMFAKDPFHGGLQFKRVGVRRNIWSVRVGLHYRAVGLREGETITWYWIGTHAQYDQLLGRH